MNRDPRATFHILWAAFLMVPLSYIVFAYLFVNQGVRGGVVHDASPLLRPILALAALGALTLGFFWIRLRNTDDHLRRCGARNAALLFVMQQGIVSMAFLDSAAVLGLVSALVTGSVRDAIVGVGVSMFAMLLQRPLISAQFESAERLFPSI